MKKYLPVFNRQTLIVVFLSTASACLSWYFQFRLYIDFLILGLIIAFPLTLTMKLAFKRRERALQSLSSLKASIMSLFYSFENRNITADKKRELEVILITLSDNLTAYLSVPKSDFITVRRSSEAIVKFVRTNNEELQASFSSKVLFFLQRVNKELELLSAIKNHHTPSGIRGLILIAIYFFAIFYPASLLNKTGFDVQLWYVIAMGLFKSFILISLYNTQELLEYFFERETADAIRLDDFSFAGWIDRPVETPIVAVIKKKKKDKH